MALEARFVPGAQVSSKAVRSAERKRAAEQFLELLAREQDEPPLPPLPTKINSRTKSSAPALDAPMSRLSSSRAETAKDGSHAVLILPDAHFPYQDAAAMEVAEATAALIRPRRIVILGDWLDCAGFSSHPVKSAAEEAVHDYQEELQGCAAQIDRLYKLSGAQEVVFIEGNHEQRVERECRRLGQVGKAIHSMLSPSSVLGQNRPWLTWVPYVPMGGGLQRYEVANDLWAIHGWSIATHAAAKHLDLARTVSVVYGHTHRQQLATNRLLDTGKIVKAWSPGCLSSTQPAWAHTSPTTWCTGLSVVFCSDDRRKWTDYIVTIENGTAVLPGGTSIRL